MKLSLHQLPRHLNTHLLPAYLVTGNEHLLVQEAKEAILKAARQQGFTDLQRFEANKDFNWHAFIESVSNLSLFSEKRVIYLSLNYKPSATASSLLAHYLDQLSPNDLVLIVSDKLDSGAQTSPWFSTLHKRGGIITVWPLAPAQFSQWLMQRLRRYHLRCEPAAIEYLIYQTEGNLLALAQEIEKLTLLFNNQSISLDHMIKATASNARYSVFHYLDILLEGNVQRSKRALASLKQEAVEPSFLLWAITREVRHLINIILDLNHMQWDRVVKKHNIWDKRQSLIKTIVKRHTPGSLHRVLLFAAQLDHTIKGLRIGNIWDELEIISVYLSGCNEQT